ncbi:MAG: Ig-like domain-containing protein [Candidatus Sericytochromatia bacterium]
MISKSKKFSAFSLSLLMFIFACNQQTPIKTTDSPAPKTLEDFLSGKTSNSNSSATPNSLNNDIPASINDPNKKPLSISISNSNIIIKENELVNLYAEVKYENDLKDRDLSWKVSNAEIATIGELNGILKGIKEGTVDVIATSNKDKNITAKITVTVSKNATISPTSTPSNTSTSPTPIPTASKISTFATFNGKIYDVGGNPVNDAIVSAKSLEPTLSDWVGSPQTAAGGAYIFRDAPINVRIEITVTRNGYTSKSRTEVLKSNLNGDPNANIYDFGGTNAPTYALQDEPEVTSLKINGSLATVSDTASTANLSPRNPDSVSGAGLVNINPKDLTLELTFSEPVNKDDIRQYLRLVSTSKFNNRKSSFNVVLDSSSNSDISTTWNSEGTVLTVKFLKPLLANYSSDEARYLLEFSSPFRDISGKPSLAGKCFNFGSSKKNDFHVFSVTSDNQDPTITSVKAIDGGTSNDKIEITFSEPFNVINQNVPQAILADPLNPNTAINSLFAFNTANNTSNDATILGFNNNGLTFNYSYVIGRLKSLDIQTAIINKSATGLFLKGLGGGFTNTPTRFGGSKAPLVGASINGNIVTLEFSPNAFDKDDRVIVSGSSNITGSFTDAINTINLNDLSVTGIGSNFYQITDPSGKRLSSSNSSTSSNISINDSQKVSVAQ